MSDYTRRSFLRLGALTVACLGGLASGALSPRTVLAAWPQKAFDAADTDGVMKAMYDGQVPEVSAQITIVAPEIAENGTVVPITVSSAIPNTEAISFVLEGNPRPLAATYRFPTQTRPEVTTRFKLAKTQPITAIVRADGKLYKASREIKVTIGGCGG
ncbi:thiosulfate oxidation carrier protein SoxY [Novispirillum sp. DQ9]|uniref:thiosulfate oxidation carrier protein SoxY n=1 Tax=Novispirillum sp. DQ9 TaxID=3398612 RepID=UPI003C7BF9B7